jgi:hypothetical protein
MVPQEEEWWLYAPEGRPLVIPELPFKIPGIWAEDNLQVLAQSMPPVVGDLKLAVTPISQKQYFILRKAQVKIHKKICRLLKYGIL